MCPCAKGLRIVPRYMDYGVVHSAVLGNIGVWPFWVSPVSSVDRQPPRRLGYGTRDFRLSLIRNKLLYNKAVAERLRLRDIASVSHKLRKTCIADLRTNTTCSDRRSNTPAQAAFHSHNFCMTKQVASVHEPYLVDIHSKAVNADLRDNEWNPRHATL